MLRGDLPAKTPTVVSRSVARKTSPPFSTITLRENARRDVPTLSAMAPATAAIGPTDRLCAARSMSWTIGGASGSRGKGLQACPEARVLTNVALDRPSGPADRLQGLAGEILLRPNVQVRFLAGRGEGDPRPPGREIPVGTRYEVLVVFFLPPGGSNHWGSPRRNRFFRIQAFRVSAISTALE